MLTVSEAKRQVESHTKTLEPKTVQLYDATGLILAKDVYAGVDIPSFNQSAMDGYGIRFRDLENDKSLRIDGEIPAGVNPDRTLLPDTAVRIFTGAPVPEGCDTVVMQEKVIVDQDRLSVRDPNLTQGANIRMQGSQIKKGELALKAGNKVSPGAAGFLSLLGYDTIDVYRPPRVCIINTGKELSRPGIPLDPGKVYECNSFAVNAALRELNISPKSMVMVDDDIQALTEQIRMNLGACDLLILSGGVSVGDYDFVYEACENCGVEMIFHKVSQKPGKPIYFGKSNNTLVFGLPGNPSAFLTCFYEYTLPSLMKMMGYNERSEKTSILPITESYEKKAGLTYFLKGKLSGDQVIPLPAQESYLMNSFAYADCLIQLNQELTEVHAGDLVEVHKLW